MSRVLTNTTCRRLDIQGFERTDASALAEVARWLRLAFGLCAAMAGVGTAMASSDDSLAVGAGRVSGGSLPVHPFDLIYNYGIRFVTGTSPLPWRGAPSRFACGLGAVWLVVTAWVFHTGHAVAGYALGGLLTGVAVPVAPRISAYPHSSTARYLDSRAGAGCLGATHPLKVRTRGSPVFPRRQVDCEPTTHVGARSIRQRTPAERRQWRVVALLKSRLINSSRSRRQGRSSSATGGEAPGRHATPDRRSVAGGYCRWLTSGRWGWCRGSDIRATRSGHPRSRDRRGLSRLRSRSIRRGGAAGPHNQCRAQAWRFR